MSSDFEGCAYCLVEGIKVRYSKPRPSPTSAIFKGLYRDQSGSHEHFFLGGEVHGTVGSKYYQLKLTQEMTQTPRETLLNVCQKETKRFKNTALSVPSG